MYNLKEITEKTQRLLDAERVSDWEERFSKYISTIEKNNKNKVAGRAFHKPVGLSLYSSVSRSGKSYDLRFRGQSVGTITESLDGKVTLKPNNKKNGEYFGLSLEQDAVDWNSEEAEAFRRHFRKLNKSFTSPSDCEEKKMPKSEEHRVENRLLYEFNKKSSNVKTLCNIQPIKLYDCFFQMPTPLKASTHAPEYQKKGGGIDILARIKHKDGGSRLCIMEVKDENVSNEPQSAAMCQAVTYAVFIANLLRSASGQHWWDFLMGRHSGVSKEIPEHVDLEVVTIMPEPEGDINEGNTIDNTTLQLERLNITLHCCALYYDKKVFELDETFEFSGTFLNHVKNIHNT